MKKLINKSAELIFQKKHKAAISLIKKSNFKTSPELLINLATCYQLTDRPSLAVKYFEESLKITKKYPQIYSKLIMQKMHFCDWIELKKYFKIANKFYSYQSPFVNVLIDDKPKRNLLVAKSASARISKNARASKSV